MLTMTQTHADFKHMLFHPSFIVASVMLLIAGILSGPVSSRLAIRQFKEAIPLRKSLSAFDEQILHPYRVYERQTLNANIIDALGTDQYLSWALEDTSLPASDPLRHANLFITYYTGGSSLVPHTPDICYLGVGYDAVRPHENLDMDSPSLSPKGRKVPIRVCTFAKTAVFHKDETSVVYTFSVNGQFAATQHQVRVLIHDLSNKYAYFSKVEVSFPRATREQSIAGAQKLFNLVLPYLSAQHWPDFEQAEQEAKLPARKES